MDSLKSKFGDVARAVEQGNDAEALAALLWIHDNPTPADPSSEMFRRGYGFLTLAVMAKKYEPAKIALLGLVKTKRDKVAAGSADDATAADLRALEAAIESIGM